MCTGENAGQPIWVELSGLDVKLNLWMVSDCVHPTFIDLDRKVLS